MLEDETPRKSEGTYICGAHDATDLLHRIEIGAQPAMHSEDLLVDDSSDREAVEAVGESLPQLDVISTLALIVETVDSVDGGALMVATEDKKVLGVLDLIGQEKADGLERLLSSIYVVAKEEIVGLGREATVLK